LNQKSPYAPPRAASDPARSLAAGIDAFRGARFRRQRDNANDSRYWGFVPEDSFIGRAFLIWYSAQDSSRAGSAVQ
jgi:hypothetical protein